MLNGYLGNRYQILEQMASKGESAAYKAKDTFLDRFVTIKTFDPACFPGETFIKKFHQRAREIAGLLHPNIVSIYDVGQEENTPYIVIEYVDGVSLRERIDNEGHLGAETAAEIAEKVLGALDYAHKYGIVHGNIKPENILIAAGDKVKITDFEICGEFHENENISRIYAAPERAAGETADDPRSDIYAVGAVLYEMVTGEVLKPEESEKTFTGVFDGNEELAEIVSQAVNKNPALRFSSAGEMLNRLRSIQFRELEDTLLGGERYVAPRHEWDKASWGTGAERNSGSKSGTRKVLIIIAILVLLSSAVGLGLNSFFGITDQEVQVPNVVGMSLSDAEKNIESLGMEIELSWENDPDTPANQVIGQDIEPGTTVTLPSTIELTVSSGPNLVEVPDLYDKTLEEAGKILNEIDLKLDEKVEEGYSEGLEKGHIYRQVPSAGEKIDAGNSVTVYVSQGSEDTEVPYLIGLTEEEASTEIAENDLVLDDDIETVESETFDEGLVVGQDPGPGTKADKDSKVKITLSSGSEDESSESGQEIEITVPGDGEEEKLVEVTVANESNDTREIYSDMHDPGETLTVNLDEYEERVIVRTYIDGSLTDEMEVRP